MIVKVNYLVTFKEGLKEAEFRNINMTACSISDAKQHAKNEDILKSEPDKNKISSLSIISFKEKTN